MPKAHKPSLSSYFRFAKSKWGHRSTWTWHRHQKDFVTNISSIYFGPQVWGCTEERAAYDQAKQRCENPNNRQYKDYGGRGILFRFVSFFQFLDAVGLKAAPHLTLDRINNDGHYEPGNVRWTTMLMQARNRRLRKKFTQR